MTPAELLARRAAPPRLVIFDCDGVLVDSEPISDRVTAAALTKLGWTMTQEEAGRLFLGLSLSTMVPMIEARIGRRVPEGWIEAFRQRLIATLAREATEIPGAVKTLRILTANGVPWRVASNSSHEEMGVKFARIGVSDLVAGRLHSHRDVPRGKPAPDLFLAAAAAEGVAPAECIVVEDSVPGATAAAAAGMDCLGFAPHGNDAGLRAVGAVPFRAMAELPELLGVAP